MKKQRLLKNLIIAITVFIGVSLFAQEEIILDPSQLTPADTGYYIGGVWKDKDQNGEDEFYNGCIDEYGDANHNESGVQQGFTYYHCMIMPDCWPKDAADDHTLATIDHPEGYIEITKTKYYQTDSAVLGYIISPPVKNLVSLDLEVSADNSTESKFWLEISKDNGATWELSPFIEGTTGTDGNKKGIDLKYDAASDASFAKMITASQESSLVIRLMTKPQMTDNPKDYRGQRLKVHWLKIVAERASAVKPIREDLVQVKVMDNMIFTEQGNIEVYNLLGQSMGSGNYIAVKSGIYIVRTENGATQKVLVR